ncbi:hypothetical protein E4U55_002580 [Claviceps digitariae]|nr:hypothetical protein E4U55_002580 [Claviceps digitariae]
MRFSAAAVLAFAASTLAQTPDFDPIYTPKKNEVVAAGSALTVTWDAPAKYASGTISIELIGGATQNTQQHIANIASGVQNGAKTYTWNIDASLGAENVYGLVFKLESDPKIFQYSNPFHIKASGSGAVTTTTTTTTSLSSSTTPTSMTAAPTSGDPKLMSSFVTKTEEFTTTVPCPSKKADSTGNPSAPADSSAPTASNPIMTSTSGISPVPTSGAGSIRVGSIGILAVAAAALLL